MSLESDAAGDFVAALRRMGLLGPGESAKLTPLTGGVSSDIVCAHLRSGTVCIKRALPKLKVKVDWQAPVERNRWEVEWMRVAASIEPDAVPRVLGVDPERGMFAMAFLDPQQHPVWKSNLRDGVIDADFAARVGARLCHIHSASAHRPELRQRFDTGHIFFPIRLDPYLLATGRAHPYLAARLSELVERTFNTKLALVHGDASPKNILCGPQGPVFLDAECAWYGDPAFDLAFCLNHMLLKCTWRPQWSAQYLACFEALSESYLRGVDWEAAPALEQRTAALLPALFLARVDGKSPVEYITQEWQRDAVRRVAGPLIATPVDRFRHIARRWAEDIATWPCAAST
jgi:aminoglycoside phosphotransferase (APT) family kinase protein